jgi:hypothetical protein
VAPPSLVQEDVPFLSRGAQGAHSLCFVAAGKAFDPRHDISGASLILDADGAWPTFHDSTAHSLNFWRGNIRPEASVWIGPIIDVAIEWAALEEPFIVVLRFHDCSSIRLDNFDSANDVFDLTFVFRDRGYRLDGETPLPLHIYVNFVPSLSFSLQFDCFRVEVLERAGSASRGRSLAAERSFAIF